MKGLVLFQDKKARGDLTRMTSSLSVTWVVNSTTPDLDLEKKVEL